MAETSSWCNRCGSITYGGPVGVCAVCDPTVWSSDIFWCKECGVREAEPEDTLCFECGTEQDNERGWCRQCWSDEALPGEKVCRFCKEGKTSWWNELPSLPEMVAAIPEYEDEVEVIKVRQ
jgi:ribosomal protein L37E